MVDMKGYSLNSQLIIWPSERPMRSPSKAAVFEVPLEIIYANGSVECSRLVAQLIRFVVLVLELFFYEVSSFGYQAFPSTSSQRRTSETSLRPINVVYHDCCAVPTNSLASCRYYVWGEGSIGAVCPSTVQPLGTSFGSL